MTTTRANLLCFIFIVAVCGLALYLYPSLPDQIPTHWNIHGEIDGYTAKSWGVSILPLIAILVFVVMRLVPGMSPKGFRTDDFSGVLNVFVVALTGFLCSVAVIVLLVADGKDIPVIEIVFAAVGLLFIVVGNYLGKVRKNFFLGIRTPWTLASDEVWIRTHRLGGRMFAVIGLLLFLNVFLRYEPQWLLAAIVLMLCAPVIYSYLLYRKVEGSTPDEGSDL